MSHAFPETGGYLKAGPFKAKDPHPQDLRFIEKRLLDMGIFYARSDRRAVWTSSKAGFTLEVAGDDVCAYFVDADELEVSHDQLSLAFLELVAKGAYFRIIGRHESMENLFFYTDFLIRHDGLTVTWEGHEGIPGVTRDYEDLR